MTKLTFEQLPEAVAILLDKVTRIENLLESGKLTNNGIGIMTAKDVAKMLDISMSSLYKMTYNNEIAFYKPGGNKLYFKTDEVIEWVLQHRIKSTAEIEKEALNYLTNNPLLNR